MKRQIRLIILTASLVVALSAGLGWANSPINQNQADYPVIAANGHGPGNGSGNGGDGPMDGTGHGPGDCSLNQMMNHPAKDFLAGHGKGHGKGHGRGHGPGDGSGDGGKGPRDGSGNGPGDCTSPINS